ncbi:sodium-coupled monocarboxylate transporter 2 isoform X2 [Anabrus simplex]|uniref:sodium-coupled monocarboxylate transporter 2 isoform X2 n=1 Tax=Anabrus simplex TaxID=316456 RepID=UPI0034DDB59E
MSRLSSSLVYDYILFVLFIVLTTGIPLWSKSRGKKKAPTKADYVFAASSKVSMFAMMLSIARGTLGVRSVLGFPSELYYRGSAMWETVYGMVLAYPIVCFVFLPVYYSLGITSVYQYLDMRFKSRLVRCLASFTYVIRSLLNLGVTVFTPCVALKTVIGLPYWVSIIAITSISVFFTLLGGLKAAIHADVIQGLVMTACSLAVIIQGCINLGGVSPVINISKERGRLQFFKTLMANIPIIMVLFSLSWVAGMVIFANYADCDPLKLGLISKIDEIVPFFVEDQFMYLPGLLGIFMAGLFNGALSLAVSIINSLSTVTWEDFFCLFPHFKTFNDKRQLIVIKLIGAFYGLLIIGIAFGVGLFSGVIESSMLMTSATSGPLLGVFLLAMLFPVVNWKGAAWGMIVSHIVTLWITFGGLMVDKGPIILLPLSTANCTNDSYSNLGPPDQPFIEFDEPLYSLNSTSSDPEVIVTQAPEDFLDGLYSMTYMYYTLLGCGITVFLGIIISYCTGTTPEDAYDEKLIHPLALKISNWFPGPPRKYTADKLSSPDKNITPLNNTTTTTITSTTIEADVSRENDNSQPVKNGKSLV